MIGNPRCPVCGLYELGDGSEETLYTCECDDDSELVEEGGSDELTSELRAALERALAFDEHKFIHIFLVGCAQRGKFPTPYEPARWENARLDPLHAAMLKVVEIAEQATDGKTRLVIPGDTVYDRMVRALDEIRKTLDGVK